MSNDSKTTELYRRLATMEADNARLRTALAEAEARTAESGHEFLLRDGVGLAEQSLQCRHFHVPGRVSVIIPAHNAAERPDRDPRR
jgi:hypothetical protein